MMSPGAHARYYDADNGRFLSPDTIVPSALDPQSLNRYTYVRNNQRTLWIERSNVLGPIMVGAAIGATSAGHASNWNSDYMIKGAAMVPWEVPLGPGWGI